MYCPKCGQTQAYDEVRFCSRCGLALSALVEWLATGHDSALNQLAPYSRKMSSRRKAIRRGAKLTFLSAVLFLLTFIVAVATNEPALLLIPLTMFTIGLAGMLYARLFIEESHLTTKPKPGLSGMAKSIKKFFGSRADHQWLGEPRLGTGEMVLPQSVTERTTNLLRER